MGDLHIFEDFNDDDIDNEAMAERVSAVEEWNPDALTIPMLCFRTTEILGAVDQLGITLNKEVTSYNNIFSIVRVSLTIMSYSHPNSAFAVAGALWWSYKGFCV